MERKRKEIARLGEELAKNYLKKKKYKILAVNFRKNRGEIDIVAKKKKKIIFFEVKTIVKRMNGFFPEKKVNLKKKKSLLRTGKLYLLDHNLSLNTPYQFDIISVEISPDFKKAKLLHFKNVFPDDAF